MIYQIFIWHRFQPIICLTRDLTALDAMLLRPNKDSRAWFFRPIQHKKEEKWVLFTVIQAVHSLLYIVAKCHFFSVVTWKNIKYLHKCEGCTHICEILYILSCMILLIPYIFCPILQYIILLHSIWFYPNPIWLYSISYDYILCHMILSYPVRFYWI